MEYRNLGRTGLPISALSFGAWVTFGNQVPESVAEECMKVAYEGGVNFFDNAEAYAQGEAERVMGRILKKLGWRRSSYLVSSKVMFGAGATFPQEKGLSRKHIYDACHEAMERLQVDYLDLYFCHRPDPSVPIRETVSAMTELIRQGKVLYWGTSEWSAAEIAIAHAHAARENMVAPVMEQPQYNCFHREKVEKEFEPVYRELGLGTTIWSPLASGLLTGKYSSGIPDDTRLSLPGMEWLKNMFESDLGKKRIFQAGQLGKLAEELGVGLPAFALAWCLKNPNVSTVITGASKVSQVEANLKALEVVPMITEEVMERVEAILSVG